MSKLDPLWQNFLDPRKCATFDLISALTRQILGILWIAYIPSCGAILLLFWDSMRGSRKFCQRGSKFDNIFDEGRGDPNTTFSRPNV